MDYTIRNYHLIALTLVCLGLVMLNKKILLGTDQTKKLHVLVNSLEKRSVNATFGGKEHAMVKVSHKDVLAARLLHVQEVCQRVQKTTGQAREVTGNKSLSFAYCVVPKAGCTMWLRVLQYMAGQGRREAGPMALSKHSIHYKAGNFYRTFKFGDNSTEFIKTSLRSLTVRDPYTRLWSAYIDKLLLPDFWFTKGHMIINKVRKNASPTSKRCGHDITFKEFITYVLQTGHSAVFINQDKHWLPASDICDPCAFQPTVIGKQETFMEDFKHTIEQLGLKHILESVVKNDPVDFEIEDEIDYNFKVYGGFSKCIGIKDLCRRMWKAFQFNGYIPPSETFENHMQSDNITKESFLGVVRVIRSRFNVSKADKKDWRKSALKQAYATITADQKEALAKLYQMDFEMFGYDSLPEYM